MRQGIWSVAARNRLLFSSKLFRCVCERCTEGKDLFRGMKCPACVEDGVLHYDLKENRWECLECGRVILEDDISLCLGFTSDMPSLTGSSVSKGGEFPAMEEILEKIIHASAHQVDTLQTCTPLLEHMLIQQLHEVESALGCHHWGTHRMLLTLAQFHATWLVTATADVDMMGADLCRTTDDVDSMKSMEESGMRSTTLKNFCEHVIHNARAIKVLTQQVWSWLVDLEGVARSAGLLWRILEFCGGALSGALGRLEQESRRQGRALVRQELIRELVDNTKEMLELILPGAEDWMATLHNSGEQHGLRSKVFLLQLIADLDSLRANLDQWEQLGVLDCKSEESPPGLSGLVVAAVKEGLAKGALLEECAHAGGGRFFCAEVKTAQGDSGALLAVMRAINHAEEERCMTENFVLHQYASKHAGKVVVPKECTETGQAPSERNVDISLSIPLIDLQIYLPVPEVLIPIITPASIPTIIQPIVGSILQPIIQPVIEPVLQTRATHSEALESAVVEPVLDPFMDPFVQIIIQPVIEPVMNVIVRPVIQPVIKTIVQPVINNIIHPVMVPVMNAIVRPVIQPVIDTIVQPVINNILQPVIQTIMAPVVDSVNQSNKSVKVTPPVKSQLAKMLFSTSGSKLALVGYVPKGWATAQLPCDTWLKEILQEIKEEYVCLSSSFKSTNSHVTLELSSVIKTGSQDGIKDCVMKAAIQALRNHGLMSAMDDDSDDDIFYGDDATDDVCGPL
mmetsp:Transcript_32366/g.44888  ORF Transcript_32366/g.44888 Transcript_32366/m.44888 type:complete len:739 (+) Transcript_32366:268-2484(+)